jgi:hypothetical protein
MGLVAVVVASAVLVGWAAGGSLDALARLRLPAAGLVPAALAVQALGALAGLAGAPAGPSYALGLAVSALLVGLFLARARRVPGLGLVTLGLALNALVVAANGAMPVSASAAARAGAESGALASDLRHEPLDAGTRLPLLADVVPVALPLRPEVVSPGDVLVAAGLGRLVVVGMRRRTPRPGGGVWQDRPAVSGATAPPRTDLGRTHGQARPQAPQPQEARREPRQAAQRLSRGTVRSEPGERRCASW